MNVCSANEDALGTLLSHDRSAEVSRNLIVRMAGDFSRSDSVCKIQEQRFNLQSRYVSQVISINNNDSFRSPNNHITYRLMTRSHYLDCPTLQPRSREHGVQPRRQGSMQKKRTQKGTVSRLLFHSTRLTTFMFRCCSCLAVS